MSGAKQLLVHVSNPASLALVHLGVAQRLPDQYGPTLAALRDSRSHVCPHVRIVRPLRQTPSSSRIRIAQYLIGQFQEADIPNFTGERSNDGAIEYVVGPRSWTTTRIVTQTTSFKNSLHLTLTPVWFLFCPVFTSSSRKSPVHSHSHEHGQFCLTELLRCRRLPQWPKPRLPTAVHKPDTVST